MIFQYTLDALLSGRKTQTRRVARDDVETAVRAADGTISAVEHNGRRKWQVGKTYAVQPSRNAASVARIRITALRHESVKEISPDDAIAEGYNAVDEFFDAWRRIHGADSMGLSVWAISFELTAVSPSD